MVLFHAAPATLNHSKLLAVRCPAQETIAGTPATRGKCPCSAAHRGVQRPTISLSSFRLSAPGGDPGGELTGMYVPRVGPHLEDGNLRESHHKSHKSRVPTCLSRDSLQLCFSRGTLWSRPPRANVFSQCLMGPKKNSKGAAPRRCGAPRHPRTQKVRQTAKKMGSRTRVRTHSPPPTMCTETGLAP